MLRILIAVLSFLFIALPRPETTTTVKRLTNTPREALNLNPSLSDDGRTVVFESSSDVFGDGHGSPSFHGVRADVVDGTFMEIVRGRMVSAALSRDAHVVAFASREDLVGENQDRNSEIFVFEGPVLKQFTHTLNENNFAPSITSDGRLILFNAKKISGDGSRIYVQRDTDLFVIDRETQVETLIKSAISDLSVTEGRAVSNDGMRFVYSASVGPNQTQVFMFDVREKSVRQLTQLGSRVTDVKLQPTISGDGKRVAFATRRRVTTSSDGSVELYVLDLPTGQMHQVTNAPSSATAEVVASLNFDGSLVAFNFPRVLSEPQVDDDFANNSEIYVATVAPRPAFGSGTVLNAAAPGSSPATRIAPGSIVSIRGDALGANVMVNGQLAKVHYVSPTEVIFVVPENVALGPGEIIVTNGDGFSSKAEVVISSAAPGVFTVSGDGKGEGIILDSDLLTTGPFDPSNGKRRLSIFATGVRHATSVSITIGGQPTIVETVARADLDGLDEIHVLLPSKLSGAGSSTLRVQADGVTSNPVSVIIGGTPLPTPTPTPTPAPTPTATPTPTPTPTPTATPPPLPSQDKIVISQVYGGGGNAGAPLRNDFIEIFNAGATPVSLAGWSVQYASATASSWSSTPLTSVVLSPGQRYLIQQAGGNNGAALPTPDATGTIAMAAGAGKVALVKSTTALSSACPTDPNIIDFVGYGSTANCFRGTGPATAASNTNAAARNANGCTDTRNNASDFTLAPPNPRNTSAPFNQCSITESVLTCFPDALAQRRNHNSAPALRFRRFP